jgi:hypothetical protein
VQRRRCLNKLRFSGPLGGIAKPHRFDLLPNFYPISGVFPYEGLTRHRDIIGFVAQNSGSGCVDPENPHKRKLAVQWNLPRGIGKRAHQRTSCSDSVAGGLQ